VARQIDTLVTRTVPRVRKAVKYNLAALWSGRAHRVSLAASLRSIHQGHILFRHDLDPVPPVSSKMPRVRYLHIHETDAIDKARLARWSRQASRLPGEKL
jgi:hypothetical protein